MAHYPEANPAFWVVCERDIMGCRRPSGCPQSLWLGQVDVIPVGSYLVWEGGLHGDLRRVISVVGIER